ncbi:MAG: insulinase family protein, partial [Candidatus Eremiobacteraeota bacterium]|nr:insulinase family protein [Candidatus Eremiobacteraeota bacterium]
RRGVIGDPENLRAATLEDVRAFHAIYYRPDNATLIVVGDFETPQADDWIDRYFGEIPRPVGAIPRVTAFEPPQAGERRLRYPSPNAPLPALHFAWHIPSAGDDDMPALDLIETLLGVGKSSRLYRALVYEHQLATSAWAGADWSEQPGLFAVRAIASAGKDLAAVESLIDAEMAALKERVVDASELQKAKTQLYASVVRSRATYTEMAQAFARSALVRGSAGLVDEELRRYAAVGAEQIRDVARRTFVAENRTVIEYVPASAQE